MADSPVQSFTHLKGRPQADRALHMLQHVASLVKPIMKKHRWMLPVLSEFFPSQDNLLGLNVNHGQKILLRLRPADAPDTFLEEEDVVETMLHELAHNVHGPHDDKFYKFLSGLQDEYDALQRSGYSGEGFFGKGQRVGVNVSHDLPPHLARAKALEAAEKRRQASQVLGSGGRLGGRINAPNLTPRELAARAAERRARDEKACASGEVAQQEAEKAANESVVYDVIDLTLDSDEDAALGPSNPKATASQPPFAPETKRHVPAVKTKPRERERPAPYPAAVLPKSKALLPAKPQQPNPDWTCRICTLINPALALQCDACLAERPPDEATGWACLVCGETGMPPYFWTCRLCGTLKATS